MPKLKPSDRKALEKAGVAPKLIDSLVPEFSKVPRKKMTGLEIEFTQVLETWKSQGQIDAWYREPFKVCLGAASQKTGRRTWYMPDFVAIKRMGSWANITAYETKGHEREDDRVKLKVAAKLYPWIRWVMVKKINGRFEYEGFGNGI